MSDKKTIPIIPTWAAAMDILLMVLEDGTERGKRMARDELKEMAHKMDLLREQQLKTEETVSGLMLAGGNLAASHWDEQAGHPVKDWQYEVANDDTRLGYLDWCAARASDPSVDPAEYRMGDE